METAKIISYPKAVVVEPEAAADAATVVVGTDQADGDFLDALAVPGVDRERLRLEQKRVLSEIDELRGRNQWQEIVALLHPLEAKAAELDAAGLATPVRCELAFALSRLNRYDEAIALYQAVIERQPDDFRAHSGLGYTAYDSLYAAKGRRIMLHPSQRKARIELAHRHFAAAQALRPDGVTNYYRQGMLFKQIQGKKDLALPLFETAVRNWDHLSEEQRKARHQQRKNFVKALYQLASCLLDQGRSRRALTLVERCIREDEASRVLSTIHKFFALGKVQLALGRLDEAVRALEMAAVEADPNDADYVFELWARVRLLRGQAAEARAVIERIPARRRRPYVLWTLADILVAEQQPRRAQAVLEEAAGKDRLGRHKALMRLARLEFRQARYQEALDHTEAAAAFFLERYQNRFHEALFWQAAILCRLGRDREARAAALELRQLWPTYPNLAKLLELTGADANPAP